jgi:hypothetical protein
MIFRKDCMKMLVVHKYGRQLRFKLFMAMSMKIADFRNMMLFKLSWKCILEAVLQTVWCHILECCNLDSGRLVVELGIEVSLHNLCSILVYRE